MHANYAAFNSVFLEGNEAKVSSNDEQHIKTPTKIHSFFSFPAALILPIMFYY